MITSFSRLKKKLSFILDLGLAILDQALEVQKNNTWLGIVNPRLKKWQSSRLKRAMLVGVRWPNAYMITSWSVRGQFLKINLREIFFLKLNSKYNIQKIAILLNYVVSRRGEKGGMQLSHSRGFRQSLVISLAFTHACLLDHWQWAPNHVAQSGSPVSVSRHWVW